MIIDRIKQLIDLGESAQLEFKSSTRTLKKTFETLCAFLNGAGGAVLVGVKNDGSIIGQSITDQTKREIAHFVSKIEPAASIITEYIKLPNNRYVIKLDANPNPRTIPYAYNGRPYWRVESTTTTMPQQRYQQLLLDRTQKTDGWEQAKAKRYTLDDLDHNEIINTIKLSIDRGRMEARLVTEDAKEALLRLNLLVDHSISNAAVVLFCKDPMPDYPQCLLQLFKFKGINKSYLLDSKRVYGNAFMLLDEAENFLLRHMSIESEFISGQMARNDIPDFAPRAIREAVVNAICHRDYTIQGGSISIMMYDDRLEIISHGILPFGITVDTIKSPHASQSRNEHITNVMYRRGMIESAGRGIELMTEQSLAIGKPEPEFVENGNTFVVCFHARETHEQKYPMKFNLTPRQQEIVCILSSCEGLSVRDLIIDLSDQPASRTVRDDLAHLKSLGLVGMHKRGPKTVWYSEKK